MGNSGSTPKNEQEITEEMATYMGKWFSRVAPATLGTQTDVFRKIISTSEVDFSETFLTEQLDGIFTSDKIVLPMLGAYNSNYLFRDSRNAAKLPLYNDENYTVMHPLGEPGLHLGDGHGSKVSHLMIIKHAPTGAITFNEMLPSSIDEISDLETRITVLKKVFQNMKDDVPLSACGSKVVEKAREMGIDPQTGIRQFFVKMITTMPEDVRGGRPGYKLMDKDNEEISGDELKVQALVDEVYGNEALNPVALIQPPSENSQLLSHIHGFMVETVPECMVSTYRDCELILKVKKDNIVMDESEEEGEVLTRTQTHLSTRS